MKNKMLVSVSGGLTSMLMARLIDISPIYKDYEKVYIYANTGKEREETLLFIKNCEQYFGIPIVWVEAIISQKKGIGSKYKVIDYYSAKRNTDKIDNPFDDLIKKFDIPNPLKQFHCTRDLKLVPINKYMKEHHGKDYIEAIGIRADEQHRKNNKFYPLIDLNIDEQIVREFWERQPFTLNLKDYEGNCDLCFKKSLKKRLTIIKENPELVDWWQQKEIDSTKGYIFDRDGFPISELKKMSKEYFSPAVDKMEAGLFQPRFGFMSPVSLEELDLDKGKDCFCSNT